MLSAAICTVTERSRSLVTVTAKLPSALDRVTAGGPAIPTFRSWRSIQRRDRASRAAAVSASVR